MSPSQAGPSRTNKRTERITPYAPRKTVFPPPPRQPAPSQQASGSNLPSSVSAQTSDSSLLDPDDDEAIWEFTRKTLERFRRENPYLWEARGKLEVPFANIRTVFRKGDVGYVAFCSNGIPSVPTRHF